MWESSLVLITFTYCNHWIKTLNSTSQVRIYNRLSTLGPWQVISLSLQRDSVKFIFNRLIERSEEWREQICNIFDLTRWFSDVFESGHVHMPYFEQKRVRIRKHRSKGADTVEKESDSFVYKFSIRECTKRKFFRNLVRVKRVIKWNDLAEFSLRSL